mmetsp:Transcript_13212/g.38106  ORF Transcript_13212/g.38106 Transcript_13212/m.38106 type:complete len:489 (+) Transcript_13212:232-1698(+)
MRRNHNLQVSTDDGDAPVETPRKAKRAPSSPDDEVQPLSPANTCETQDSYPYEDDDQDSEHEYDEEDNRRPSRQGKNSSRQAESKTAGEPTVVVIEHKHSGQKSNKSGGAAAGGARALGRPAKMAIGALLLMTTGGFAYFFKEWFRIPGLETQIQRLEKEIGRLSGEVDRLSSEVDRYEDLNTQLNSTILELDRQNDRLNASNVRFQELNEDLNSSVTELKSQNEYLSEQNDVFSYLNDNLNVTTLMLVTEVTRLERTVEDLRDEKLALTFLVGSLTNETSSLGQINTDLEETVSDLESDIVDLSSEVDRLETLNSELARVVAFINEEAQDVQKTFADISKLLSDQIVVYQNYIVRDTQSYYVNQIDHWDCLFYDVFPYDFTSDPSIPIGADYGEVMKYVDNQILSKLCLSPTDFESFLANFYAPNPSETASTDDVVGAIELYTIFAMDYYFPRNGTSASADGITTDEWAESSYSCELLPDDRRFFMY